MDFTRQAKVAVAGTAIGAAVGLASVLVAQGAWWRSLSAGFALGTVGSLFSVWSMVRQTGRAGQAAQGKAPRAGLFGTVGRWAAAGAVMAFAVRYHLNAASALAGLLWGYVLVIADGLRRVWRVRAHARP